MTSTGLLILVLVSGHSVINALLQSRIPRPQAHFIGRSKTLLSSSSQDVEFDAVKVARQERSAARILE